LLHIIKLDQGFNDNNNDDDTDDDVDEALLDEPVSVFSFLLKMLLLKYSLELAIVNVIITSFLLNKKIFAVKVKVA